MQQWAKIPTSLISLPHHYISCLSGQGHGHGWGPQLWHGQGLKINIVDSVKSINNYGQELKLWH